MRLHALALDADAHATVWLGWAIGLGIPSYACGSNCETCYGKTKESLIQLLSGNAGAWAGASSRIRLIHRQSHHKVVAPQSRA